MKPRNNGDPKARHARRVGRRRVLELLAGVGIGTATFRRALAIQVGGPGRVTPEMVRQAEWVAGLELSAEERETAVHGLERGLRQVAALRAVELDNAVAPAVSFGSEPGARAGARTSGGALGVTGTAVTERPAADDDLAFLSTTELAGMIRTRRISSVELTRLYLERLRRYDPVLLCAVNLTEELALEQAARADRETATGRYRGPLHGIPWGAKDLIAYPGYPTTWGATPYRDRTIETRAAVARRLDEAGAVLVAKLSLGALAMGDRWFRGMTRNPWDTEQGSSGSSAGPASAVAAGLVGFALGSETLGSIVSPCTRCGATGLRPTFGRVSRHGCMALSWSMDKIGPIARTVDDCALVLGAIHGFDGRDVTAVDRPFHWPARRDLRDLRVGHFEDAEGSEFLDVLGGLGVKLRRVTLPAEYPVDALRIILETEAAAAFDDLTRRGVTEGLNAWPEIFRRARFVTAVDFIRAQRVRTLLMRAMEETMAPLDAYVDVERRDLTLANLTGHPTVVLPNGFRRRRSGSDVPTSITFTGKLFGESELLAIASAYQRETGYHLKRPPLD